MWIVLGEDETSVDLRDTDVYHNYNDVQGCCILKANAHPDQEFKVYELVERGHAKSQSAKYKEKK